jgi:hypothetical protein
MTVSTIPSNDTQSLKNGCPTLASGKGKALQPGKAQASLEVALSSTTVAKNEEESASEEQQGLGVAGLVTQHLLPG